MKPIEKKLLKLYNGLASAEQDTLMAFAEFLSQRVQQQGQESTLTLPEPTNIPRPDNESVVAAIKRLSATYHMLDDSRLLNDSSLLMSQHVMQGKEAQHVIDELEALFKRYYEELTRDFTGAEEESSGC